MPFDWIVLIGENSIGDELAIFASIANGFSSKISSLILVGTNPKEIAFVDALAESPILAPLKVQNFHAPDSFSFEECLDSAISKCINRRIVITTIPNSLPTENLIQFLSESHESAMGVRFCHNSFNSSSFDPAKISTIEIDRNIYADSTRSGVGEVSSLLEFSLRFLTDHTSETATNVKDESVPVNLETLPAIQRRFLGVKPLLSIIVPTLDAGSQRCTRLLNSLREHTSVPYQVLIVDNGNAPQGFSTPVNSGVRACNTEYIAIINDDVEVKQSWWAPLQENLDAGAIVVFPRTLEGTRLDFSAWCFAMKAQSLKQLGHAEEGFFNEQYRIWFQDTDLLLRMRALGIPPKFVTESTISHGFSETLNSPDPLLHAWIMRTTKGDESRFRRAWSDIDFRVAEFVTDSTIGLRQ